MDDSVISYMTFDEVGITVAGIAVTLGFIVLVWNAIKAFDEGMQRAKKPTSEKIADLSSRVSYLEGCCSDVQGKLAKDYEFQQKTDEMNRLLLKSIKQLLKHGIDGNDKDGLQVMEDEIDNYLVEYKK